MPRYASTLPACLLLYASLSSHSWADETDSTAQTEPQQNAAPQIVRPPLAPRSEAEAEALKQRLDQREQQQLQAADEAFLALWLPANSGEPSGAVVLVPGDDESADWPQSVGPLRRKLPDAGWHTLSLTLPSSLSTIPVGRPTPEPKKQTEAGEEEADTPEVTHSSASPAEADSAAAMQRRLSERAEQVLARIESAITFAQQQKAQTIVLLGYGSGAYWAARYLSERKPESVKNLLLVAAKRPEGYSPALDELIPELKLATGDFYYKDQPSDRQAALKRSQASKRQQHPAYVQVAMHALPGNPHVEYEQLSRRLRGWLSMRVQASSD